MNRSARNDNERPGPNVVAYPIDFDLEMAVEADARLLAAVMHMARWRSADGRIVG